MARFITSPKGWKVEDSEVVPVGPEGITNARVLLSVLVMPGGQIAVYPDIRELGGIDTEDAESLVSAVRFTLMKLVRPQG